MTNGFLYYAHNNEAVDYLRLSICSALTGHFFVKDFKATLITDEESLKALGKKDKKLLEACFENIKINNFIWQEKNQKQVVNVFDNKGLCMWWNKSRSNAYNDSDYDETVLLDVDFIFQDSHIDKIWGNNTPIMMNREIIPFSRKSDKCKFLADEDITVGPFAVPSYWATCAYFNRSQFSEDFFIFVNYVKNNWSTLCKIYHVPNSMYRNDHAFSIALYMANGFKEPGEEFELPFKYMLVTNDAKIHQLNHATTRFLYHTKNWQNPWNYVNVKDISYHCMNKLSILENYGAFIDFYGEGL